MPIVFNDYFKTPTGVDATLLEDVYVAGGMMILSSVAERDKLQTSLLKLGMLVRTMDDKKLYELVDLKYDYNEDGEEIVLTRWDEIKVGGSVAVVANPKPLSRWALSLRSTLLQPGDKYNLSIPVAKVVALKRLEVDNACRIVLQETKNSIVLGSLGGFKQVLDHEFKTDRVYDNKFVFPDGINLKSRYTPIFMNKDPNIDKYVYYTLTNTLSVPVSVTAKFLFISLQTS